MLHINSSETLSTLSLVAILFSKVGSLLEAVSFEWYRYNTARTEQKTIAREPQTIKAMSDTYRQ